MAGCHEGAPQCGSSDGHHSSVKIPEEQRETLSQLPYEKSQGRNLIGLVFVI